MTVVDALLAAEVLGGHASARPARRRGRGLGDRVQAASRCMGRSPCRAAGQAWVGSMAGRGPVARRLDRTTYEGSPCRRFAEGKGCSRTRTRTTARRAITTTLRGTRTRTATRAGGTTTRTTTSATVVMTCFEDTYCVVVEPAAPKCSASHGRHGGDRPAGTGSSSGDIRRQGDASAALTAPAPYRRYVASRACRRDASLVAA